MMVSVFVCYLGLNFNGGSLNEWQKVMSSLWKGLSPRKQGANEAKSFLGRLGLQQNCRDKLQIEE